MAILDFLIFHLTYWFNKNKDKLKWSTPLERAIYAMGLATMMFLTGVNELIDFTILRDKDVHIGSIWFILLGLGTMQVYKYVYVNRDRYSTIAERFSLTKPKTENTGIITSIAFIVSCFIFPIIIHILFKPFGGKGSFRF